MLQHARSHPGMKPKGGFRFSSFRMQMYLLFVGGSISEGGETGSEHPDALVSFFPVSLSPAPFL